MNKYEEKTHDILAVIVPGVGYHVDKPLLYYSRKLLLSIGAELVCISYSELPKNIMNDEMKMMEAFQIAKSDAMKQLEGIAFSDYKQVIFVSKSIGTVVSLAVQSALGIEAVNILYTPLKQTFLNRANHAVAFYGTKDPWTDLESIKLCSEKWCEAHFCYPETNHSLETGEVLTDLANMHDIMHKTYAFIQKYRN